MTTTNQKLKWLNITLWAVQSLMAIIFVMAGANKLFQPIAQLSQMLPWVTTVSEGLVRFIGISELSGGLGLLLPSILKIKPVLTPVAAIGLTIIMILAMVFHVSQSQAAVIGVNFIFMALLLFIVWGRYNKLPIPARN